MSMDLVQHACVVLNVFLFNHTLKRGADLFGESVNALALELHILHVHLVDLFFDELELLIQAGFLCLKLLSFPLSLADLLRNGNLNLMFKVFLLLLQFGFLLVSLAGLDFNSRCLFLHLRCNEGICLFVSFKSVQLFYQLLRPHINLQLDNLSLKLGVFRVLRVNFLLRAHFGLFKLFLKGNKRLHRLEIALFILALDSLCSKLFLHVLDLLGLFRGHSSWFGGLSRFGGCCLICSTSFCRSCSGLSGRISTCSTCISRSGTGSIALRSGGCSCSRLLCCIVCCCRRVGCSCCFCYR